RLRHIRVARGVSDPRDDLPLRRRAVESRQQSVQNPEAALLDLPRGQGVALHQGDTPLHNDLLKNKNPRLHGEGERTRGVRRPWPFLEGGWVLALAGDRT